MYPYVPAGRGGGDYSESPKAQLRFKQESVAALPRGILDSKGDGLTSIDLVILEASPSSILAADPREAGGPICWRGSNRPKLRIAEIRRDDVESISYLNPTSRSVPPLLPVCAGQYAGEQLDLCCPAD